MANFRAERLFIRVAGVLDFDPNEGIDAAEFAYITVCDGAAFDRPSLQDFTFAPHERQRWFSTSKGLATIRALIAEREPLLNSSEQALKTSAGKETEVLRAVEHKLEMIDVKDYKFYFLARDLG